jgi:exodeoxyribonuclease-5
VVVRDVTPERCDLASFGVAVEAGLAPPLIETLSASVDTGEATLTLRLLPPIGSAARQQLDQVLQRLRGQAREASRQEGRGLWRRFFLLRDAFASLGPAAVLSVHRSQGSSFGEVFVDADVFWPSDPELRRQLVYVAVSRARQGVTLMAEGNNPEEQRRWHTWLAEQG